MSLLRLSSEHLKQLKDSAIAPDVIAERGYSTAERQVDLKRLGFGGVQAQLVPALVIPIRDVYGYVELYQVRPDTPRMGRGGKTVKYETKAGSGLVIDVPERVRSKLGDPHEALWITEGAKKVDSALSHGLSCIGLIGVYGWRGTNDKGGKTALADLEQIAWNERKVYLAFDSDAMEKPEVHQALDRFAIQLNRRGAEVRYIYIPSTTGDKVGLDDYLAAGGTVSSLLRTASSELYQLSSDELDVAAEWKPDESALETAEVLLDAPDLLDRIGNAIAALGVAGDLMNAKILYLAITSRLLDQPINVKVEGPSSAGKSYLVQKVAAMFPERATYALDGMSDLALVYLDADLRHRHLIVNEAAALQREGVGAAIMRAVAWGGQVRYATVDKSGGELRSRSIDLEGPTGLITTTTKRVESELETRLLTLHVADTPDVTRQILRSDAARLNGYAPNEPDLDPWHALQWWLANKGTREVIIPFAEQLAELVAVDRVRARRDWRQIANLISASAILHQQQREEDGYGRIVATRADYELIHSLTAELFSEIRAEGVTQSVRDVVEVVRSFNSVGDNPTISQVARELGLERSTVSRHVKKAYEGGWLVNLEERRGRPAELKIGDPLPEERSAIPGPAELPDNADVYNEVPTNYTPARLGQSADCGGKNGRESGGSRMLHANATGESSRARRVEPVKGGLQPHSSDTEAKNSQGVYACADSDGEHRCAACGGPVGKRGLCLASDCEGVAGGMSPFDPTRDE